MVEAQAQDKVILQFAELADVGTIYNLYQTHLKEQPQSRITNYDVKQLEQLIADGQLMLGRDISSREIEVVLRVDLRAQTSQDIVAEFAANTTCTFRRGSLPRDVNLLSHLQQAHAPDCLGTLSSRLTQSTWYWTLNSVVVRSDAQRKHKLKQVLLQLVQHLVALAQGARQVSMHFRLALDIPGVLELWRMYVLLPLFAFKLLQLEHVEMYTLTLQDPPGIAAFLLATASAVESKL
jgi:hypothetical protein